MIQLLVVLGIFGAAVVCFSPLGFARRRRAGEMHPFNVHDLLAMERISDLQAAPDGRHVAFVKRVTDLEHNRGQTDIWVMPSEGGPPRRLTAHEKSSSQPRWSADSRFIHFLSGRSGSSQVWRIAVDGGEAEQVTDLPLDVGSFALSPTGGHVVVGLEVFPDARTLAETKERLEKEEKRKSSGRAYDRLFARHWDAWKDGRRSHLFALPLEQAAGGRGAAKARQNGQKPPAPVDLMAGMDADCPSKPFGGAEDYAVTPDGNRIVFAARNVGREEAWSTHFDLFLAPLDGKRKAKVLVSGQGATLAQPTFSPDGKTLAYLAMKRPQYEADRQRIVLLPWKDGGEGKTGRPRWLTEEWDRSPHRIVWSRDSRTIYTAADDLGFHPLFAADTKSGHVKKLAGGGKVTEIAAAGRDVVFGLCHHQRPVELYRLAGGGGRPRRLTEVNKAALSRVRMGESEQFSFAGWNGEKVYGWVFKPADFAPRRKYPVAFLIHGGPQGSFGSDFHYRWNPQVYAGAGYGVVMIDFHGSTGYGQDFTDAINQHWGDRPLEDLQKGLAVALERYSWLDPKHVAALGASYGGYMINWIHGVWSAPFRCFVCHDGNLDERMAYYETEELWFPEWECGGTPWDKPEAHIVHNPIDHVHRWSKPTLVIHGQKDFRVVDTQGLATFTALQRRGIPSRLLYFPDENHWVLKPHNSLQWHEEVLGWLERWV